MARTNRGKSASGKKGARTAQGKAGNKAGRVGGRINSKRVGRTSFK